MQYKFYLASDIHIEFRNRQDAVDSIIDQMTHGIQKDDHNTLLLAGDVGIVFDTSSSEISKMLTYFLKKIKELFDVVIYVPGNHEYYNAIRYNKSVAQISNELHHLCDELGVVFLDCNTYIHPNGYILVGVTLWTCISEETSMNMNDVNNIYTNVMEIRKLHALHKKYLRETLDTNKRNKIVVVTHHVPSFSAIHPRYDMYQHLADGYACDCEDMMSPKIRIWCFGHSHEGVDVVVNGCHLKSNPMGYPGEYKVSPFTSTPLTI